MQYCLQRQGIGRKLMALLVRDCLSRGATGCLVFAPRERVRHMHCPVPESPAHIPLLSSLLCDQ